MHSILKGNIANYIIKFFKLTRNMNVGFTLIVMFPIIVQFVLSPNNQAMLSAVPLGCDLIPNLNARFTILKGSIALLGSPFSKEALAINTLDTAFC